MRRGRRHPRPNPLWYWRNWYHSTLQMMDRNRVFARNHWLKIRRLESCCGNYGEPGC